MLGGVDRATREGQFGRPLPADGTDGSGQILDCGPIALGHLLGGSCKKTGAIGHFFDVAAGGGWALASDDQHANLGIARRIVDSANYSDSISGPVMAFRFSARARVRTAVPPDFP